MSRHCYRHCHLDYFHDFTPTAGTLVLIGRSKRIFIEFHRNNHKVKSYSDKEGTSAWLSEARAKLVSDTEVGYLDRRWWVSSGIRCMLLCGWYIVLTYMHIHWQIHTHAHTHVCALATHTNPYKMSVCVCACVCMWLVYDIVLCMFVQMV